jgi:hypothetical protein
MGMVIGSRRAFVWFLGAILSLGFSNVAGQGAGVVHASSAFVIGWVEIQPGESGKDQVTVVGRALALEPISGQYALVVSRSGKGGTSISRQGGAFSVTAGENAVLSTSSINISPAEVVTIELKLFVDNNEVFSTVMKSARKGGSRDI